VEEVRDDRLLKGLATLFPGAVNEAVGAIGVYEDTAVTTTSAGERRVRTRSGEAVAYTSRPTALALSLNFFAQALALSLPNACRQ